jgi:type II secretory pathway pseudopilin PulG
LPRRTDRRFHGFTLVEALVAAGLVTMGVSLAWDGWLAHQRVQNRLDADISALGDLSAASEQLARDVELAVARPRVEERTILTVPTRGGEVRWSGTPHGWQRRAPGEPLREFRSLVVGAVSVEDAGGRAVAVVRLRGPGDAADTVLARLVPAEAAR